MDFTYEEISNQPTSWKKTLDIVSELWSSNGLSLSQRNVHLLFFGCGTSYYLAQSAARLFQEVTGMVSIAAPASEIALSYDSVVPSNVEIIGFPISRSGTTSEVLIALEHLKKHHSNSHTIALTCHSESKLADISDVSICLDHAREQSVVMTQSFTNMLLAIQWIAADISGRSDLKSELSRLPDLLRSFAESSSDFGTDVAKEKDSNKFIYLGLGNYYGMAREATLKLKEMTQTACEAYNPLEFRHGPISTVESGTAVVLLASVHNALHLKNVASDVTELGARVVVLAPEEIAYEFACYKTLELPGSLSDWSRAVLYMPALQYLAYARALELGLNPAQPRHLGQVVVLRESLE